MLLGESASQGRVSRPPNRAFSQPFPLGAGDMTSNMLGLVFVLNSLRITGDCIPMISRCSVKVVVTTFLRGPWGRVGHAAGPRGRSAAHDGRRS